MTTWTRKLFDWFIWSLIAVAWISFWIDTIAQTSRQVL